MAYTPIVVEGYSWNVVCHAEYLGDDIDRYMTYTQKFEGDSVINGITYKKLWSFRTCKPESRKLEGLIREDISTQKVWAYGNGVEALMYDFDVQVGDTISLLHWLHEMENIKSENIENAHTKLVITNVETVTIAGIEPIKKITFYKPVGKENQRRRYSIYERFGSPRGWLISDFAEVEGGGSNYLICTFDTNGELVFKPQTNNSLLNNDQDCIIDTSFAISNTNQYAPMLYKDYNWNIVNRRVHLDGSNTIEYKTIKEKIGDYEYIDNKLYWPLYRSTDNDLLEYEFIAHLHESNRKIFALIGDKEYLLYDFNCKVGDTIKVLKSLASAKIQPEMIEMTIKHIDEIEDLVGNIYQRFVATIEGYPDDVVYYERYGSEHGWYTRPYDGIVGGGTDYLMCAWGPRQNYLLFKPDHNNELDFINDCYLQGINTNAEILTINSQSIYYNTTNKTLNFNIEGVKAVKIYDTIGRKVYDVILNQSRKQLTTNLNKGIYIINIMTEKQEIYQSKIVVK